MWSLHWNEFWTRLWKELSGSSFYSPFDRNTTRTTTEVSETWHIILLKSTDLNEIFNFFVFQIQNCIDSILDLNLTPKKYFHTEFDNTKNIMQKLMIQKKCRALGCGHFTKLEICHFVRIMLFQIIYCLKS